MWLWRKFAAGGLGGSLYAVRFFAGERVIWVLWVSGRSRCCLMWQVSVPTSVRTRVGFVHFQPLPAFFVCVCVCFLCSLDLIFSGFTKVASCANNCLLVAGVLR